MDKQDCKEMKSAEQLILDAALKEFAAKGFDGARTASIAAEAGVTHAMLHYYFRTKEQLFQQIYRSKMHVIFDAILTPMIDAEGPVCERIAKFIAAHFEFLQANRELPLFLVTTLNSRPDVFTQVINEFSNVGKRTRLLQQLLDDAAERGEIRRVDVKALMGDIVSLNVFPFLTAPMMMTMLGENDEAAFFESRKRENIETILRRIS